MPIGLRDHITMNLQWNHALLYNNTLKIEIYLSALDKHIISYNYTQKKIFFPGCEVLVLQN